MLDRFSKTDDFYMNCFVCIFFLYFIFVHMLDFLVLFFHAEESNDMSKEHEQQYWKMISSLYSPHGLLGRVINETLNETWLVFPTYEERFASFSVDVRYPRVE